MFIVREMRAVIAIQEGNGDKHILSNVLLKIDNRVSKKWMAYDIHKSLALALYAHPILPSTRPPILYLANALHTNQSTSPLGSHFSILICIVLPPMLIYLGGPSSANSASTVLRANTTVGMLALLVWDTCIRRTICGR